MRKVGNALRGVGYAGYGLLIIPEIELSRTAQNIVRIAFGVDLSVRREGIDRYELSSNWGNRMRIFRLFG